MSLYEREKKEREIYFHLTCILVFSFVAVFVSNEYFFSFGHVSHFPIFFYIYFFSCKLDFGILNC